MQQGDGGSGEGFEPALVAVERELAALEQRQSGAASSVLASVARALAADVDSPGTSATARAAAARQLRETWMVLAGLVPEERAGDLVDDLAAKRARRKSAAKG